jgi:hypothetical protein
MRGRARQGTGDTREDIACEEHLEPAGAIQQKVTVSPWKKSVVLLRNMRGVKGLTFLHQYCRSWGSLAVFFHT